MDEDANLRVGFLSTKQDAVVSEERGTIGKSEFESQLLEAVSELNEAYPGQFRSLIADGDGHTFIIRDFERFVGGIAVKQWITDMLNSPTNRVSVSD